jgi:DNA-binding protein YbaB
MFNPGRIDAGPTNAGPTEHRLSQWAQGFAEKAEQFHAMRAQVEQVQVSESSRDGAVRVTVDSSGALTDLAFTGKIRDLAPPELAAQVLACLRRAQQQLAQRVQEAMQSTVGDEQRLVESVVSGYRERFGEDLPLESTEGGPGVLGLGAIEDDNPPQHYREECPGNYQQPPRRYPCAAPPDDEEYFADRGYLS